MFECLEKFFLVFAIILWVSVPLAIWKAIEIIIWLWNHIDVSVR